MEYTDLEKKVYNAIIDHCYEGDSSEMKMLQQELDISTKILRGAVSSLIKKGKITSEIGTDDNLNVTTMFSALVDTEEEEQQQLSFGCDYYSEDEIEKFKL